MPKDSQFNKTKPVELGSSENRVLLAIRAANRPESAVNIRVWMPRYSLASVMFSLYSLRHKKLVAVARVHKGVSFYDLTETGRALVHPKTGPLNFRNMASATATNAGCRHG